MNGGQEILSTINQCRKDHKWDLVAHTQDSHPADHCSFVDNHEGAEVFSTIKIPTPDQSGEMEQVMWPRHCVQKSKGWDFAPELVVEKSDFVQQKGQDKQVRECATQGLVLHTRAAHHCCPASSSPPQIFPFVIE